MTVQFAVFWILIHGPNFEAFIAEGLKRIERYVDTISYAISYGDLNEFQRLYVADIFWLHEREMNMLFIRLLVEKFQPKRINNGCHSIFAFLVEKPLAKSNKTKRIQPMILHGVVST